MSTKEKSLAWELYYILCLRSWKVQLENTAIFHVLEVEKCNRRVPRYFMSTKEKSLAGELYYILCLRSWKIQLENTAIFHVHEVEKVNWITQRYFMSTKCGKVQLVGSTIFYVHEVEHLTGEPYDISCPRSGTFNWRALRYFMSTKWKSLVRELCYISSPRSGKV